MAPEPDFNINEDRTEVEEDNGAEEHIMQIMQYLCYEGAEVLSQGIVVDRVIQ